MSRATLTPKGHLYQSGDPTLPTLRSGDTYVNSTSKALRAYDGSAWHEHVTLDTAQTISGAKTFTGAMVRSGNAASVDITDGTYTVKYGLASSAGNYHSNSAAGDFVLRGENASNTQAILLASGPTGGYLRVSNTAATANVSLTATSVAAAGLTGATTATRYVGGTASGAPASGTFATGDWVIAQNGHVWICSAGGTPGTWVDASASAAVSSVAGRTGAVTLTAADIASGTFPGTYTVTGTTTVTSQVISQFAAGNTVAATPMMKMATTSNATGATAGAEYSTGSGWATRFGTVQGTWWHAGMDGSGVAHWGYDGTTFRTASGATGGLVVNTGGVWDGANRVYSSGNAPPYPVTSVATRTGAVTLTAADVGAGTFPAGSFTVPTLAVTNGLSLGSGTQSGIGIHSDGTNIYVEASTGGQIFLRPNGVGSNTGMASLATSGLFSIGSISTTGVVTSGGLLTASAGVTVPSGQLMVNGTRSAMTGTRATTTNASDTVDLGTFSSTGGALELRLHASLVTASASVSKVWEIPSAAALGTALVITGATFVGTTVTYTVATSLPGNFAPGDVIYVSGITGFTTNNPNGSLVYASQVDTLHFTAVVPAAPTGTYGSGGLVSKIYTALPTNASAAAAATDDFALEVWRSSTAGALTARFRQKSIAAAGTITFTAETYADTAVTFTPSSTITAAPAAIPTTASTYHPSNVMTATAGRVGVNTEAPGYPLDVRAMGSATMRVMGTSTSTVGAALLLSDSAGTNTLQVGQNGGIVLGGSDLAAGDAYAQWTAGKKLRLGPNTSPFTSTLILTDTDVLFGQNLDSNYGAAGSSLPRGHIGVWRASGAASTVTTTTTTAFYSGVGSWNFISGRRYRFSALWLEVANTVMATTNRALLQLRLGAGTAGTVLVEGSHYHGCNTYEDIRLIGEAVAGTDFTAGVSSLSITATLTAALTLTCYYSSVNHAPSCKIIVEDMGTA